MSPQKTNIYNQSFFGSFKFVNGKHDCYMVFGDGGFFKKFDANCRFAFVSYKANIVCLLLCFFQASNFVFDTPQYILHLFSLITFSKQIRAVEKTNFFRKIQQIIKHEKTRQNQVNYKYPAEMSTTDYPQSLNVRRVGEKPLN